MAHKKAAGSAKNLRDSKPKYRGVKVFGGQTALAGNIIIRQKGDKYAAGQNTYKGNDFSIHALVDGIVVFKKKNVKRFDGRKYLKTVVEVSTGEPTTAKKAPVKKEATPKVEKATKAPAPKKAAPAKNAKTVVEKTEKKTTPKKEATPKVEKATKASAPKKAPAKKPAK